MSRIITTVKQIQNCGSLHIVQFEYKKQILSMMSLDLNSDIQINTQVKLQVKPSHIAIAKDFQGEVSYSNQLKCIIISITNGELLSSIKLDFLGTTLESIITANSSKKMDLKVGDKVIAFIKASELSIGEVL